ncbi:DUF1156 domain-containing protein [Hymenobacter cheonanensis]|uniref:DUF1156 domain-containing protein n=1 Tax=Hymenobacter sp. CA2-7 TaxID=3063993 RepID=UPI002713D5D9|nr:hypothetical protein [Hymenobacter sp. CA2-7]MDO7888060.1 hypothetical protein [Hymenobacter sp. CA2-7]
MLDTSTGSIRLANRLAFDVEFFARRLLGRAEAEIGHFYPADEKGRKPIAYYWARVGTCANPSCRAEVPLLKQFYLSKRRGTSSSKWVHLKPSITGNKITFSIAKGEYENSGWNSRGNLNCPVCASITNASSLKAEFHQNGIKEILIATIKEGNTERLYELPSQKDEEVINGLPSPALVLSEKLQVGNNRNFNTPGWSVDSFGQMFSKRQLLTFERLLWELEKLKKEELFIENEYNRAIVTYLGVLVDRIAARNTSYGVWHILQETVEHPFGRQAIPMVFDYPEMNPFGSLSGSAYGQLDSIVNFIQEECGEFSAVCKNASSGDESQFEAKSITAVVTDPPYYDAIAYADLSDFFYIWLKRTLGNVYPLNFAFPLTPKKEECTALKHHHKNNDAARAHFEKKLQGIFNTIERQTSDMVSIMFAHQSTEAWTTLCNSVLGANMNITGSWAIDTEVTGALKAEKAFLSSSVTVACRPVVRQGEGNYKRVRDDIEATVAREVDELYRLGFRGADLLTACFGQAVSVFGQYERVEKSDGTRVTVAELLALARESAFKALLKGFDGDEYTKFYIGWLQLYGLTEADFDDAAKFSRAGLQLNVAELLSHGIFAKKGNKLTLATSAERLLEHKSLGVNADDLLLDQAHRALGLYHRGQRRPLVQHLARVAPAPERPFWRVLTALGEVLPAGADDHRLTAGLLADRDSLLREVKQLDQVQAGATGDLFA